MSDGRYIDVAGLGTYYETRGAGEPLLLLHGGLCSIETFQAMVPHLAEHFLVIAPERRGHGRTPDTEDPLSYEAMADETFAFMDALNVASADVIGFSDGANVGLLMALRQPERVRRLVSMSGNFRVGMTADPLSARAQVDELFADLAASHGRLSPDGPAHTSIILQKLQSMWGEWEGIPVDRLGALITPTLVMSADADIISLEHTVELYQALPNAQLAVTPNTSHNLIRERPDLVNQLILDFLAYRTDAVPGSLGGST